MNKKKTFSIVSLGCFRNTYDSEVLVQQFADRGYKFSPQADTLIINTCGFIDSAKEESLAALSAAVDLKNKGKVKEIIVAGCLAQRYGKKLKRFFPEVDVWSGVVQFSPKFKPRKKLTPFYTDFLKICEGCLNRCSFCAIPLIKGPLRSRHPGEIIAEAKYLDRRGLKELNIIGQDITSWAKDLKNKMDLTYLLKRILKETKNIKWIRLIYTHPRNFKDSLIALMAEEERICKYIDLPIQHINDRILKVMRRRVTASQIRNLIRKLRNKIPDCTIRTSVITGFPTETEGDFRELLTFLTEVKFERLGAFIYSREEGTPACSLPGQVHPGMKKRRRRQIMDLQKKISARLNLKFIGRSLDVLVEKKEGDVYVARTEYDAPEVDGVVFVRKKRLKIGDFYRAKIVDAYDYDLVAV